MFDRNLMWAPLALAGALLLAPAASAAPDATPTTPAASDAAYRLPSIVAKVNGVPITRDEVDTELERNQAAAQVVFALILSRALDQRAQALGIVPTKPQIEAAYEEANTKAQNRLPEILTEQHSSRDQFTKDVLIPQLEFESLARHGVVITDADIAKYFADHKAQWAEPDQITLARIKVPDLATAKKVEADLAKGEAWGAVLKAYDTDPEYYKDFDGDWGSARQASLPKEISDAVKDLKEGAVSQPMPEPGGDGYIIWKVTALIHKDVSLAPHKDEIRQALIQSKAADTKAVIRDLLKETKVTDLPPGYYEKIILPWQQEQPVPPGRPGIPGGPGGTPPPPPPPM